MNATLRGWLEDVRRNPDFTREDISRSGWVRGTGEIVNFHNREFYEKIAIGNEFAVVNYWANDDAFRII